MLKKKISIFCFSGTGNTLNVAFAVKDKFNSLGFECTLKNMFNIAEINNDEMIGLMFPVAMQSTYPLVWNFVNDLPEGKNDIFMIDTMAGSSGGIVGPMKKILNKKGYNTIGAKEIVAANNLSSNTKKLQENLDKNNKAVKEGEQFVLDLISGKTSWGRVPLASDAMRLFSKTKVSWKWMSQKKKIDDDKCVRCLLCVDNCPTNAISFINNKIEIDNNICISCMRCVHYCPQNAFKVFNKTLNQNKPIGIEEFNLYK